MKVKIVTPKNLVLLSKRKVKTNFFSQNHVSPSRKNRRAHLKYPIHNELYQKATAQKTSSKTNKQSGRQGGNKNTRTGSKAFRSGSRNLPANPFLFTLFILKTFDPTGLT